jgi:FkbH-like protein
MTDPSSWPKGLAEVVAAAGRLEAGPPLELEASVAFARNVTIEGIEPYLRYALLASGVRPIVTFGGYDLVRQDVGSPDSALARAKPMIVVLALALEHLDPQFGCPGWSAAKVQRDLAELFDFVASHCSAVVAVNTFVPPMYPESGLVVPRDGSDATHQVHRLNQFVRSYVAEHASQFCLMDWERYVRVLGEEQSLDYRYWYLSKAPFKGSFLQLYAGEIAKVVRILHGKAKKVLVLDCDNTLWGGVVGEDGLDGIKLDGHDYPGKAYYDFQKTVLHLANRGVLITLCSKNNEADVMEILERHPWCLLKTSHLSGWRVNWQDKVANIRELAEELNLGLDSFVLVDDSALECEMVRRMLPEVTVLPIPEQLYRLPQLLVRDGLFDTLAISDEDRKRAQLYKSENQRKKARGSFQNIEDYLESLEIVAEIRKPRPGEIARVAQLTQKTNQFNLTTRRYSEEDIARLVACEDTAVYSLTARDKFGALGLVGVFIAKREGRFGSIDSYLLSCRALGRDLEMAFLSRVVGELERQWGVEGWRAEYRRTSKNAQVADFWDRSGFAPTAGEGDVKRYHASAGAMEPLRRSFIRVSEET